LLLADLNAGSACKYGNGGSGLPPTADATFTMKNIQIINRVTGVQSAIYFKTVE
jgi:hypothetical protein